MPGATIPSVSLETAEYLISPSANQVLMEATAFRDDHFDLLQAITRLRKLCSPEQALAAWELVQLRTRAVAKFGVSAECMFFTREALEQASSMLAAEYHARRFTESGCENVIEVGCGIGADTLVFARTKIRVTAYEIDPERALFIQANVDVLGLGEFAKVVPSDGLPHLSGAQGIWIDPARRTNAKRVSDPESYTPPLSVVNSFAKGDCVLWGVKIAPSVRHELASIYNCDLEFVSDSGECKEGILWGGKTAGEGIPSVSAVVLTGERVVRVSHVIEGVRTSVIDSGKSYLFEPDPAVIRAHLVEDLGVQLQARPIDPRVAYLVGHTAFFTPLAVTYEIIQTTNYSRRNLQSIVDAHGIGKLIVKKRGFDIEPEDLVKQIKMKGKHEAIVVIARVETGHQLLLVRRLVSTDNSAALSDQTPL